MPRITTGDVPRTTIDALARVARENNRTPAREAVVAIQSHILVHKLSSKKKVTK